jgi:hypothetical protein
MLWQYLSVAELAEQTDGHIRSQTSEPVALAEIEGWIEEHRQECEAYLLAPHAIAARILAEEHA